MKGQQTLKAAEVLVYDRLGSEELLSLVPEDCERIYVGKEAGHHIKKQSEINRILVEKALEGKRVIRLKGGDPFVFGRGGEEIQALTEAGIPYEVIPGVTSASGHWRRLESLLPTGISREISMSLRDISPTKAVRDSPGITACTRSFREP